MKELHVLRTALIDLNTVREDPLPYLANLFSALRPAANKKDQQHQLVALIALLESSPELISGLRANLLQLFSQRHGVLLLATSGIFPATGVLTETIRRISHRLLPEVDDAAQLKDALRSLLRLSDETWLQASTVDEWSRVIELLDFAGAADTLQMPSKTTEHCPIVASNNLILDALEALRVVAHRIAAAGLEPEMLRLEPSLENHASPFLSVCEEALLVAQQITESFSTLSKVEQLSLQKIEMVDLRQLDVLIDQTREAINKVRRRAAQQGASFYLTFRLHRLDQHLNRLDCLATLFAYYVERDHPACNKAIASLWRELAISECQQNKVLQFWLQNAELVALRVTENAGRSGEHYITETRTDYFTMLKAAAGGGIAIALIAAVKINIISFALAPLTEVLANCLTYGVGFVIIHLLNFSVATKQPAMTANAIAAAIDHFQEHSQNRQRDLEPLVTLIAATVRTQLAAILGNIGLAIPTALLIAYLVNTLYGTQFITPEKASHVLSEIDLLSLGTLIFAAMAGVCLFLAGLIAGYFDNLSGYSRIADRLFQLSWAQRAFGVQPWRCFTEYIRNNLGVLAGNFFLGFLLGGLAGAGVLLGLPLDVRHTTLSSAMWGYAIFALDFQVSWQLLTTTPLGILGIGIMNLSVSFYLALSVALRSRAINFTQRIGLFHVLVRRFVSHPTEFFLPPARS